MQNPDQLEDSILSYDNIILKTVDFYINEKKVLGWKIQGHGYHATSKSDFIYIIKDDSHETSSAEERGLKFHVSIDPDKFAEGLKILINIIKEYGILVAKFPNPFSIKAQEAGKEICIYAFLEPNRTILFSPETDERKVSWQVIITELTKRLHDKGVQPGAFATGLLVEDIMNKKF